MVSSRDSRLVFSILFSPALWNITTDASSVGWGSVIGQGPPAVGDLVSSSEQSTYQHKGIGGHLHCCQKSSDSPQNSRQVAFKQHNSCQMFGKARVIEVLSSKLPNSPDSAAG